jgi:hypothetical protein
MVNKAYSPMTLAELSRNLCVSPTDDLRWTDVMEFLEEYRHESPTTRQGLLAQTPEESAEPKWDVFLGALAEHLAIGDSQPIPAWACSRQYSWCGRAWFVSDLPTARVWALAHSPAAFRARGIFLHPDDLVPA